MNHKLEFQKDNYNVFFQSMNDFATLLTNAVVELKEQGITGYNCQKIKDGNFLQIFEDYHRKQQLKSQVTKKMLFEKYLELYGYKDVELRKLEITYKTYLKREFSFYSSNTSFFDYCKLHYKQNSKLKPIFENAPKIKVYNIFDFVSFKGNNIDISVSKELYTLYATNQKQVEVIQEVTSFVAIAKKLNLDYLIVRELLNDFLINSSNLIGSSNRVGMNSDMELIFDYNKILVIQ